MIQIYPRLSQIVQHFRSIQRKQKPKKQLFCSKPFSWIEPSSNGQTYLCCPAWLPVSVGSWRYQSLDDMWNSPIANDIRRSIMDGSFRYCDESRCSFLQTISGPVMDLSDALRNKRWGKVVRNEISDNFFPTEINCAYDRSCNLKCVSCRKETITRPSYNINKLHDDIIKHLPSIEHLYVTGSGDPFASKMFWSLLTSIDGSSFPNLAITLHTNGLLFTEERWGRLRNIHPNIKEVHVSIDAGTEETYRLNRGADWGFLNERLRFISNLKLERFIISMVIQANNFREVPLFIDLAKKLSVTSAQFTVLNNWGTYSKSEFSGRAVQLPGHREYEEFMNMLKALNLNHNSIYWDLDLT